MSHLVGGIMVSVLESSAVDFGFEHGQVQTKDFKIGICCFCAKHATIRSRNTNLLARNRHNVSLWSDISIRWLVSRSKHCNNSTRRVVLVQSGHHHHIIEYICSRHYMAEPLLIWHSMI